MPVKKLGRRVKEQAKAHGVKPGVYLQAALYEFLGLTPEFQEQVIDRYFRERRRGRKKSTG